MAPDPRFVLTDGTTEINFLASQGFLLRSWSPVALSIRDGGLRNESGLADGSVPVLARRNNSVEQITFVARHASEDAVYEALQNLLRLLERAVEYWTSSWAPRPVWLEARGPNETETRYATVVMYSFPGITGPFEQPLFTCLQDPSTMVEMSIEHLPWQNARPGDDVCVKCSNLVTVQQPHYMVYKPLAEAHDAYVDTTAGTISPSANFLQVGAVTASAAQTGTFTPTGSTDDASVSVGTTTIFSAVNQLTVGRDASGQALHAGVRFRNVTIPNGAVITSARLRFHAYGTNYAGPVNVVIKNELLANAPAFGTYADFMARTRGGAAVLWNRVSSWVVGYYYDSPDISPVVQEIINLGGGGAWSSGDSLVLFIEDDGSNAGASRRPYSVDSAQTPVQLIVTWEVPSAATSYHTGIRFSAMSIPANAVIAEAHVRFQSYEVRSSERVNVTITGENVNAPAVFSAGGAGFAAFQASRANATAASVQWNDIQPWSAAGFYQSPSVKAIVQELISTYGAVPFLKLFLSNNSSDTASRRMYSYDGAGQTPELHVWYHVLGSLEFLTSGQPETCEDEVYIANKCNTALINTWLRYDPIAASYSANLVTGAGYPKALFAATGNAVNNDSCSYFGSRLGPFCSLIFDISRASAYSGNARCYWEYWNGSAWAYLDVVDDTVANVGGLRYSSSGGQPFSRLGVNSVAFAQPSDWTVTAVNGVWRWWVRVRAAIAGLGSITPAPLQDTRNPYTVTTARVRIGADQTPGDIPMLGRVRLAACNAQHYGGGSTSRLIIGARSLTRAGGAEGFAAYINYSDSQNLANAVYVRLGPLSTWQGTSGAFGTSATGRYIRASVPAQSSGMAAETFFAAYPTSVYVGTFHAYLRYRPILSQVPEGWPLRARLTTQLSQWSTPWVSLYNDGTVDISNPPKMYVADLGRITLQQLAPLKDMYQGGSIHQALYLCLENTAQQRREVDLIDLVLMPADEWLADVRAPSYASVTSYGHLFIDRDLYLDSATMPYCYLDATIREGDRTFLGGPNLGAMKWIASASGPITFQCNADQELWFLSMIQANSRQKDNLWESTPYPLFSVRTSGVSRYLLARGSR